MSLESDFNEVTLATLQSWVATREHQDMPDELVGYMEMLERCYHWHQTMALEAEIIDNLLTRINSTATEAVQSRSMPMRSITSI